MPFVDHLPGRGLLLAAILVLCGVALAAPFAISFADDGDEIGPLAAAGTAFTYQGRLESGSVPANGSFDFRFTLYSDAVANSTVGSALTQTRTVTNGLFTADLDFGVGAFNGQERWIGVEAKQGANPYLALAPRTKLNATPYALYALNYPDHDHFGDSWSGFAGNGLSITNSSTDGNTLNITANGLNSIALKATNAGICPEAPETCYGVWGIATNSPGGSGFGGVGVRGDGTNTGVLGIGPQFGIYGSSPDGVAIQAASSGGTGLRSSTNSDSFADSAIVAEATESAYGIRVTTADGYGLDVEATNSTGVYAMGSPGIQGYANKTSGTGVHGVSNYTNGIGVVGFAGGSNGVGIKGTGTKIGVFGAVGAPGTPTGTWSGFFDGADVLIDQNLWVNGLINGTVIPPSDERLKNSIQDIPYGLDQILAVRPVSYALNSDPESKEHLGVIAQEIESVLPGLVERPGGPEGMLGVNYTELIPVLIKAIQEQQAQIEALESPAGQHITASLETGSDSITREEFEAELAAVRAQTGQSDLPWLPLAAAAIGLLGAGFAIGRRKG